MGKGAVVINENDNVATATEALQKGSIVSMYVGDRTIEISVVGDIAFGHKFAIRDIKKGENVVKYGENIGIAIADIAVGEHTHVHNVKSQRGRGDLYKKSRRSCEE